jgi:hypothetical protein
MGNSGLGISLFEKENKMYEDVRNPGQPSQRDTDKSMLAKGSISRRELLKTAALLASAATVASVGLPGMTAETAGRAEAAVAATGGKLKVIDFRCRPPLKPYSGLYKLRQTFLAKRPNRLNNPPPKVHHRPLYRWSANQARWKSGGKRSMQLAST